MTPFERPTSPDDEFEGLTDEDLAVIEDDLLLANELASTGRLTLPRLMLFFLMFVSVMLWSAVYGKLLPSQKLGPLNIPLYLAMLGLAIATVQVGWKLVGWPVRNAVRFLLAHWLGVLYLLGVLYGLS